VAGGVFNLLYDYQARRRLRSIQGGNVNIDRAQRWWLGTPKEALQVVDLKEWSI
jgi:hypothetical protein